MIVSGIKGAESRLVLAERRVGVQGKETARALVEESTRSEEQGKGGSPKGRDSSEWMSLVTYPHERFTV